MGLTAERLRADLAALAALEPGFAAGIERHGWPAPRVRERGHLTLLRTIVGQQVSVQSADAIWRRLEAAFGLEMTPAIVAGATPEALREIGLSRQKAGYVRSLCELVAGGTLDLTTLPEDDEAAIAALTQVRGIGRWSAEIYLLFAEGRPDIWPAGDLAVQVETGLLLGRTDRPSEAETRLLAEPWRPLRGAAAVFVWHHYTARLATRGGKQPL